MFTRKIKQERGSKGAIFSKEDPPYLPHLYVDLSAKPRDGVPVPGVRRAKDVHP